MNNDNTGGGLLGAITNLLGMILGIISVKSLAEAVLTAFIGALVGLITSHIYRITVIKIKKKWRE